MAELAASAITLAGLFRLCIEAFDFIQTAKRQTSDLKRLNLKLNIERCRLFAWGDAFGLTAETRIRGQKLLESNPNKAVILQALGHIHELLTDSESLAGKYGCIQSDVLMLGECSGKALEGAETTPADKLAAAFDKFKLTTYFKDTARKAGRISRWVVHDREKFCCLIQETKELIDGLQNLTKDVVSSFEQDQFISSKFSFITDEETLDMLAEVCGSDHPALSYAASARADDITMPPATIDSGTGSRDERETWGLDSIVVQGIESLSITDLKRRLITYMRKEQTAALELRVSKEAEIKAAVMLQEERMRSEQREEQAKMKADLLEAQQVAEQARQEKLREEIRAEIVGGLVDPPTAPPVKFKDAIGRTYYIPFQRCQKWRDMKALISQAFAHIENLSDWVEAGNYDLLGPDGEIIMPEYWKDIIQPHMDITMMIWPMPDPKPGKTVPEDEIINLDDILNPPSSDAILNLDDILNPPGSETKRRTKAKKKSQSTGLGAWLLGSSRNRRSSREERSDTEASESDDDSESAIDSSESEDESESRIRASKIQEHRPVEPKGWLSRFWPSTSWLGQSPNEAAPQLEPFTSPGQTKRTRRSVCADQGIAACSDTSRATTAAEADHNESGDPGSLLHELTTYDVIDFDEVVSRSSRPAQPSSKAAVVAANLPQEVFSSALANQAVARLPAAAAAAPPSPPPDGHEVGMTEEIARYEDTSTNGGSGTDPEDFRVRSSVEEEA